MCRQHSVDRHSTPTPDELIVGLRATAEMLLSQIYGQGLGGLSAHVKNIVCCFFRSYWPVGEKVTRALFPSTLAT